MGRKKKYVDEYLMNAIEAGRNVWPPMSDNTAIIRFIGYKDPGPLPYEVWTRYEFWGPNGKDFTKWHMIKAFKTNDEANAYIKDYKEFSVNKKVHLKEELKINVKEYV